MISDLVNTHSLQFNTLATIRDASHSAIYIGNRVIFLDKISRNVKVIVVKNKIFCSNSFFHVPDIQL